MCVFNHFEFNAKLQFKSGASGLRECNNEGKDAFQQIIRFHITAHQDILKGNDEFWYHFVSPHLKRSHQGKPSLIYIKKSAQRVVHVPYKVSIIQYDQCFHLMTMRYSISEQAGQPFVSKMDK